MLCSFTVQVQAQLDLLWILMRTKKNVFQLLQEELVEKVATWHLPSSVWVSPSLLSITQIPSVPSFETLELRPRRNKNSSRIELIRSVRALCGLRLTHDGLNDFSP